MSDAWKSYPRAPRPGTRLCAVTDLPGRGTLGVQVGGFPVLLVQAGGLRAFVNACPHRFLPLDYRGRVLSADGEVLRCSNHAAGFDAETGMGIDGYGQGCWLDPVPVEVRDDGQVVIARA
jgi:nitrite reductase/ring-hydroxylating ferredoxin subunit